MKIYVLFFPTRKRCYNYCFNTKRERYETFIKLRKHFAKQDFHIKYIVEEMIL